MTTIRTDELCVTPKLMRELRWVAKARHYSGPEALADALLTAALKQMCPDLEARGEAYSKATLEAYNKAVEGI